MEYNRSPFHDSFRTLSDLSSLIEGVPSCHHLIQASRNHLILASNIQEPGGTIVSLSHLYTQTHTHTHSLSLSLSLSTTSPDHEPEAIQAPSAPFPTTSSSTNTSHAISSSMSRSSQTPLKPFIHSSIYAPASNACEYLHIA